MFLVMGITGRIGSLVARQLLAQGKQVRALVRDRAKAIEWANQGVELIVGEWHDADAMIQALQDTDGAFIMLPPVYQPSRDFTESTVLIEAYVTALRAVPLPKLVVLSSNGAEKTSGLGAITPLSLLERALSHLPSPQAFIRAGSFYENFLHGLQTAKHGVLTVFYANTSEKSPMTATEDIGTEAVRLLTGPIWTGRRVIELGSMVSPDEVAAQLGSVLGREVRAQALPREAWVSTLEQMGFPSRQTWAFEEIYDGVNSHWIGFGVEGAERVEGTTSARDVFAAAQRGAEAER
ncbi:NmrA family NAD(P)-binding protein [Deinococcus altitudinis]|uniref:NmrA family NAD(P)-binding protein n=1 Tax=Deinococcus altitudinis TaxID=468914 RepID=UPI00389171AD